MNHWATPVHHQGFLYGIYGQSSTSLRCIDLATGAQKWSRSGFGYGSVLLVNGILLVLSDGGGLRLVEANPTGYVEIDSYQALDGSRSSVAGLPVRCWNVPAISNGRIYVRSTTEAVCLDVSIPPPPALTLVPHREGSGSGFSVFVRNLDGTPISPARAARIRIRAGTQWPPLAGDWARLTNGAVLTDGQLRFEDDQAGAVPRRFFMAEEVP
jgi:outer membrane protein assembly factor BamB